MLFQRHTIRSCKSCHPLEEGNGDAAADCVVEILVSVAFPPPSYGYSLLLSPVDGFRCSIIATISFRLDRIYLLHT